MRTRAAPAQGQNAGEERCIDACAPPLSVPIALSRRGASRLGGREGLVVRISPRYASRVERDAGKGLAERRGR